MGSIGPDSELDLWALSLSVFFEAPGCFGGACDMSWSPLERTSATREGAVFGEAVGYTTCAFFVEGTLFGVERNGK